MYIKMKLYIGALALALGLSGCSGSAADKPAESAAPQTTADATAGGETFAQAQELFTANKCISCHGVDLAGRVGPKTNLQKVGASLSKEQIAEQIRNGGNGMPVYKTKLTEEEIGLLADWLSSKQ